MKFVKVTSQEEYDLVTQKMSKEKNAPIIGKYNPNFPYINISIKSYISAYTDLGGTLNHISATEYLNSHTLSNEAVTLKVKLRGNKVKINVKELNLDKLEFKEIPHFSVYKAKLFNRVSECSLALYEIGKVDYKFDTQADAIQWIKRLVSCF